MSKRAKILMGFATILPVLCMALFFVFFMLTFFLGFTRHAPPDEFFFPIFFVAYFLALLSMLILTVVYIVHLFKTDRVPNDQKALWAVVLFLGNMLAMPVYWYLYIWREPKEAPENTSS